MKVVILALSIMAVFSINPVRVTSDAVTCYPVKCATSAQTLEKGDCYMFEDNTYWLKPCPG